MFDVEPRNPRPELDADGRAPLVRLLRSDLVRLVRYVPADGGASRLPVAMRRCES